MIHPRGGGGMAGDVLDQVAAQGHVQHLMPPADAEDGFFQFQEPPRQIQLVPIPEGVDALACSVALAVQDGIHVRAAGEQQAVAGICQRQLHGKDRLHAAPPEGGGVICPGIRIAADENSFHGDLL